MSDRGAWFIAVISFSPFWIAAIVGIITWAVVDCGAPWTDIAKAQAARRKRWKALVVEYLQYGFSPQEARQKADAKMQADAKSAEAM